METQFDTKGLKGKKTLTNKANSPVTASHKLEIHKIGVAFFVIMGVSAAAWIWISLIANFTHA